MSKKSLINSEKWYYDACTLDQKNCFYDIVNKKPPKKAVISHLSLGEAYGNCHHTKKKDPIGSISALAGLIERLREGGYVEIVGHDGIDKQLKAIKEFSINLSTTDSIHLATAIKKKCYTFVSIDRDFLGISRAKLAKLGSEFCISELKIIKMRDQS